MSASAAHRLVDEDVAHAAAGIADQHHVGLLGDLVGDRLQEVGVEHLVPVVEIAEQERRVDEGRRLGEGRHVRRRDDAVVDRLALRHVLEILLLEAERGVLVQDEVDRLAVILLDQLLELDQRLGEGVVVVELHGAVERDGRLRLSGCRESRRPARASSRPGRREPFCVSCLVSSSVRRSDAGHLAICSLLRGPSAKIAQPISRRQQALLAAFGTCLFPQQDGRQPERQRRDVGDEHEHDQHRDVERSGCCARPPPSMTLPMAQPTTSVGPTGGVSRPMPRLRIMMMPKCTGSMPNGLDHRQEDRRADQQHRRQVHEGAEHQQQDVDQQQEACTCRRRRRGRTRVALAGTCISAIM